MITITGRAGTPKLTVGHNQKYIEEKIDEVRRDLEQVHKELKELGARILIST
jgi:uncharacterized protein YydD (DUF2326 family)